MADILLINGQHIKFSITFTAPPLSDIYKSFTVKDKLIDGLLFNDTDSAVKINGNIVAGYYFLYDDNNNIECFISNIEGSKENKIEVILDTTIIDTTKINNNNFNNTAFMYVNNDKFLENTSNECNVQLKMPSQNELIITPESQRISTFFSENKNLVCNFGFLGIETENADSYIVQTKIIDGYNFDENSTKVTINNIEENIQTFIFEEFTPTVTYEYNEITKIVTITILNNKDLTNNFVNIHLAMKPIDIPVCNHVNNLLISLYYNTLNSKIIDIKTSSIILNKPINLVKSCDKYEKKLDTNTIIYYTLSFLMPNNNADMDYISFTVSDHLDKCLAFDLKHSSILCDNVMIEGAITFPEDKSTGIIDITFRNYEELSNKNISIRIACYIYDLSLVPSDDIIYNDAVLIANSNSLLPSTSNKIGIRLRKYNEIQPRNDIISSIASIERSNSSILSGEADLLSSSKKILFIN